MKIFIKYIAKSMLEKKARFFLLILAIAMSTGLLVAISGTVNVAINSFEKPMKEYFEGKEIGISAKEGDSFLKLEDIKSEGVKDLRGEITLTAISNEEERTSVAIRGREDKDIKEESLLEGNLNDFSGEKCIISKDVSDQKDFKLDDELEVFIGGQNKKFKIAGISKKEGVFYNDKKNSYQIIVPYKYLSEELKAEGKYNYVTANKDVDNIKEAVDKFNDSNTRFKASELFNTKAIEDDIGSFTLILYVMLIIVLFMSAIIIFGSFKLTITERLSVIGTFLSQGATNGTVEKILFLESVGYGIIGGILGDILGYGGLYLINTYISKLSGNTEGFSVNPRYFIIGSIFAVIFSVISALVPILRIRKLEVKEVILNDVNISMRIGWGKFIGGVILILASIFINSIQDRWVNYLSGILIIISVIGLVLMYPKVIDLVTNILFKLFRGRSKVGVLALNNLRTSKVLMGNITLIVISLLSIFMITSVGTSLKEIVSGVYDGSNYDISIEGIRGVPGQENDFVTNKIIGKIKENESVEEESIQTIRSKTVTVNDDKIAFLDGVDSEKYQKFYPYLELDTNKYQDMYKKFKESSDGGVIISDKLKRSLNIEVGDKITVDLNDIKKDLDVIGVFDAKLMNNGQVILMKNNDMEKEFNVKEASMISFKTNKSPDEVKEELKPAIKELGALAITNSEEKEENIKNNQVMISILSIFSYLAIFIAALGVLNNIIIGFLQRKRELAVLSSVGMTDGARNRMLLAESILSVLWAVAIAVPYSYLGLSLITKVMTALEMPMDVILDVNVVPVYGLSSLVLIILASLPILLKSKKLSIINELKYE